MNKVSTLSTIVNWTWELPQTLVGAIMSLFIKHYKEEYKAAVLCRMETARFGMSLGRFIFVASYHSSRTVKHEYGHCRQSKYLGPLYLPIVGLTSSLFYWISVWKGGDFSKKYYQRFPENWADKLGGVTDRPRY
jgi:hypothetical protein